MDTPIQNIGTIKGISLEPVSQRSTGTNQCLFMWMFMSTFINALTAVANGQKLNSKIHLMESTDEILRYHIDIVFCLDCTGSMNPVIELLKNTICRIPNGLKDALAKKDKQVHELRIRLIAFRDFANDLDALEASEFFVVEPSTDSANFESFVNRLGASGGGDEPESGLEALAIAMGSDWTDSGDKQRHLVVMFTDASAHKLEDRVGAIPSQFIDVVPADFDGLTDNWDGGQAVKLKKAARRLIIFGPDCAPWNTISDAWGQVVYLPSQAGKGLEDVEYSTILDTVANSV